MTDETQTNGKRRLLIVEDQKNTLWALEFAVSKVMPKYFEGFTREDYDVAKCYYRASEMIGKNAYEIVLLDHRMPFEDMGNLEDTDFRKFSSTLVEIGYSLIPAIKNKNQNAVVIGTSSLPKEQLEEMPKPDFRISKNSDNLAIDLENILKQMKGGND